MDYKTIIVEFNTKEEDVIIRLDKVSYIKKCNDISKIILCLDSGRDFTISFDNDEILDKVYSSLRKQMKEMLSQLPTPKGMSL